MSALERDAIRMVAMAVRKGARAASDVREAVALGVHAMTPDHETAERAVGDAMALYGMIVAIMETR